MKSRGNKSHGFTLIKSASAIVFVFVLFPGFVSYAASGACSGHGGVSCSAGPDGDGSVICNDGWRNSSVSYVSMKMCVGYQPSQQIVPIPEPAPIPVVVPVSTEPAPAEPKKESVKPPEPMTAPIATTSPVFDEATNTPPSSVQKPITEKSDVIVPTSAPKRGFWARLLNLLF